MMFGHRALAWAATTVIVIGSTVGLSGASAWADDSTTRPAVDAASAATQPAQAEVPATTQPSAHVATVTPEARKLLDQVKDAYSSLKSLDVAGTSNAMFDVDGQKTMPHSEFKGLYQADGKFRSETNEDEQNAVIGCTGDKVYFFVLPKNDYLVLDAPKGKLRLDTLSDEFSDIIRQQNYSLALALAGDAAAELIEGADNVSRVADVTIDNVACPALLISRKEIDMTVVIDPANHLVRRQNLDLSKLARLKGAQDVKTATVAMDYKNVANADMKDAQFTWAPPAGAHEIKIPKDATSLKGQDAPQFKLDALDGSKVSSADLKGSVYILDFWATWCGPCVQSLPGLDKIYQDNKAAGLKVFACNQGEDKDAVQKFVNDKKLTIPVLLDSDSSVGGLYYANAIPETVLVGKDGKVLEVFVGAGNEDNIRQAAEAALKAK